ncbi:MAG TPA: DUF2950 domain-containing protein [Anaeromyxobacter sp.]|nr:DUF2950 domain-containing protein [Anaeromyxobacter sp.]
MRQPYREPVGNRPSRMGPFSLMLAALILVTSCSTAWAAAATSGQKRFETPEQAVQAFTDALRTDDKKALGEILGSSSGPLLTSGDKVADDRAREAFLREYDAKHRLEAGGGKIVLYVGADDFPFPIPVVPDGDGWRFDTAAGKEEILNRRIGRNERAAIQVALAYVDAQREYYAQPRKQGEVLEYAQRIASTPGKRDGLYWDAKAGEPMSPLGPLVAKARAEGYRRSETQRGPVPYHGYYYRILTGQGPDAPGGATDYVARGHMIGGFGLVAFPAEYGVSGVMTFIVNHDGIVYQKNLGPSTATRAQQMKLFNPDAGWQKVTPN